MGDRPSNGPERLTDVMDALASETEGRDRVRVSDAMDAFKERLFGPMLIVPGLVLLTPLGGVPLAPAAVGVLAALVAGQRVFGRDAPWVPGWLKRQGVRRELLVKAFEKARPWTRRIDKVIRHRLAVLVDGPAEWCAALLAAVLGASVPVVGIVPLAAILPGLGLVLIGLALVARDGVLMLAAMGVTAGVLVVAWQALF